MVLVPEEPLGLLDPKTLETSDLTSQLGERETAIVEDMMEAAWEGLCGELNEQT